MVLLVCFLQKKTLKENFQSIAVFSERYTIRKGNMYCTIPCKGQNIASTKITTSKFVRECSEEISKLGIMLTLVLNRIPGYRGRDGIDKSDELANQLEITSTVAAERTRRVKRQSHNLSVPAQP